jgi:eukaryotic-like serine/threonine-protein kinase
MAQLNSVLPEYIGRFKIIKELGKGSQGIVYLASDKQLERHVAIKTIQLEKSTPKIKQQLLVEARTIAKLQHPNIITLYEMDEHLGTPYLVFEYVDGQTLKEYLIKKGKLNTKQTINILSPLLNAIAYAHKSGVIHRDLNPSNILITQSDTPRLMDFGIATLLGQRHGDGIWGTFKYMSPEQCNNQNISTTSDIFSLGLILFELISGKRAIDADNKFSIINKIVNEEIQYPDSIEVAIKEIIQKAVLKNPQERYVDAIDFKQDLENHLQRISPEAAQTSENHKNSSETNSTLQFLLRRMEHKKDFPTMSHQVVEISQKAKAGSDSSANILSNAILKDYSLSSKLLRLVNSPLYGQYGGRISTVSRAVVILGFEEVRNAALGLMLLDHLKDKNQASSLKEACISSMISGSLAHGVADKMNIKDKEEAYVCSMFHQLGKLLSIYYFPEETEIIFDVVKQKNMKEQVAAESVLGVSFEEIGIAVGESWQLPAELVDSMHTLPPGELKKPLSQSDLLKHVSGFSNEYCEMISTCSAQERQQSFEALASRFSKSMSISRSQMEEILSNALSEMEKYAKLVNLDLGKSEIFNKANKWSPSDKTGETVNDDDDMSITQLPEQQTKIIDAIQEITDAILEGAPLNDILIMVMETIFTSFNFHRVMFCFINKGRTSINARFGFGPNVEEIINRLSIPNGGEDIFNLSLKQAKDLIIEDTSAAEADKLLPQWYRSKFAKKSLLVYPIVVKNIPIGLIYIDSIAPVSVADESRLGTVRTLRNQIILAIRQA